MKSFTVKSAMSGNNEQENEKYIQYLKCERTTYMKEYKMCIT